MEDHSGLRCLLKNEAVYNLFQEIVGGNAARRTFVKDFVRASPGEKVVEIGCGPGQMFPWLEHTMYIGFDISEEYIQAAQNKYGTRGFFLLGDTQSVQADSRVHNADIVLCSAILHHLNDDEAFEAFQFAHRILKDGGRMVCGEPCFVPNQSKCSGWIMSKDRGKFIRTEDGYRKIAERVFTDVKTTIDLKPLRIPTTVINMECTK